MITTTVHHIGRPTVQDMPLHMLTRNAIRTAIAKMIKQEVIPFEQIVDTAQ